jgi:hypothetical protein
LVQVDTRHIETGIDLHGSQAHSSKQSLHPLSGKGHCSHMKWCHIDEVSPHSFSLCSL